MGINTQTSNCAICGLPAGNGWDVVAFPPFVADAHDPLYRFNDAVFHRECLEADPDGIRALKVMDAVVAAGRPDARVCAVCGQHIDDPDDYFGTGLLITDSRARLHAFNFVHLHRSHWAQWEGNERFQQALAEAVHAGWLGPMLVIDDAGPRWRARSRGH